MMGRYFLFSIGLLTCFFVPMQADACTLGVASGDTSAGGRPILWKVRDTSDDRQQLIYSSGSPYSYIGICSEGDGYIYMGLNEVGIASGNSLVNPLGLPNTNSSTQKYVLRNYDNLDRIRNYFQLKIAPYSTGGRGCFPFIDAAGNAIMFELNGSDWWLEYDSMDIDREAQGLLGFVVRANEFHQRADGTDDTTIGGRYESGTYNISGLVGLGMLCAKTIIQGNDGPNSGFEFARYGPGRTLATISRSITRTAWVVHGVLPNEDPALATAWVILGQSNYGIAVPAWVRVSDIPQCLSSGDMYDRAKSLYNKGDEAIIQASIFPFETHVFNVVNNTLLPHWRNNGVPSTSEMTRIEHQIANDAYSLLDCLDNFQSDNKSPNISFHAYPNDLTIDFELIANDSDGTINNIEWNFGDNQTSPEETPSHTYTEPGTYLISCTVTDDDGVSITDWKYYAVPINCDIAGDDGIVDIHDLAKFLVYWLATDCGEPNWCQGVDLDRNTMVNFVDFAIFSNNWLWR